VYGNDPKFIVIHFIDNLMNAKRNADKIKYDFLGISYHFIIDDSEIIKTSNIEDSTFHLEDNNNINSPVTNNNSISIAICIDDKLNVTKNTTDQLIQLVDFLMFKYDISSDDVLRHYDCTGKNCPSCWRENGWLNWWKFKEEINSNKVSVSHTGFSKKFEESLIPKSSPVIDYDNLEIDSQNGLFTLNKRLPVYNSPSLNGKIMD